MILRKCFDAADSIPASAPAGCIAVLGYVGPDPEATHVWTLAEWHRFSHLRQFPAWVANVGALDLASEGTAQGRAASISVKNLGWSRGRVIICDMEDWQDPTYWAAWKAEVEQQGYQAGWYGSRVYSADYASDFKWLADPDNSAVIPAGFEAKQYAWNVPVNGGVVDLSVLSAKMLRHGGRGPRKG